MASQPRACATAACLGTRFFLVIANTNSANAWSVSTQGRSIDRSTISSARWCFAPALRSMA